MSKDNTKTMDVSEYSNHLNGLNDAGYTAILMSLGYELKLFDTMIKEGRPLSSNELADVAGMKERYVREWLHGMAVGQVINYETETKKFYIAEHHRAALLPAAAWSVGINTFAAKAEDLKECFKKDGPYGLSSKHDAGFRKWFGGHRTVVSHNLIQKDVLPVLAKYSITEYLEKGVSVLDACCGSGEFTAEFIRRFPKSKFTGFDISEELLKQAKKYADSTGKNNYNFIVGDIMNLSDTMAEQFDIVMMFSALHDLPDPHKTLVQLHKVLKPGGHFILMDSRQNSTIEDQVGNLHTAMLYTCSVHVCLPSGLSAEPRIGYGLCWGRQNITDALEQNFSIKETINLFSTSDLFVCTKK